MQRSNSLIDNTRVENAGLREPGQSLVRVYINFDCKTFKFRPRSYPYRNTHYPNYDVSVLNSVMKEVEIQSIFDKINFDILEKVSLAHRKMMHRLWWSVLLSPLMIGFLIVPSLAMSYNQWRTRLQEAWEEIRLYLLDINTTTWYSRGIQFTLDVDPHRSDGCSGLGTISCTPWCRCGCRLGCGERGMSDACDGVRRCPLRDVENQNVNQRISIVWIKEN